MRRSRAFLPVLTVILLAAGIFCATSVSRGSEDGIPAGELLEYQRESSRIPEDWACAEALTENAWAVLFFDPEDPSECCYRLCAVREGEQGYFLRGGGDTSEVRDAVGVFPLRDTPDQAVISANTAQVARIETSAGTVEVDPEKPFVLLLPQEMDLRFYDRDGNPVTARGHTW